MASDGCGEGADSGSVQPDMHERSEKIGASDPIGAFARELSLLTSIFLHRVPRTAYRVPCIVSTLLTIRPYAHLTRPTCARLAWSNTTTPSITTTTATTTTTFAQADGNSVVLSALRWRWRWRRTE